MVRLDLTNDEFELVKRAMFRSSYASMTERRETLSLVNRLSKIMPPPNVVMSEGFDMQGIVEV